MILTPDNEYAVVLDHTVLAPMLLCDLLLRCVDEPAVFRALWSRDSLSTTRQILVDAGYRPEQAEFRLAGLRRAFPEAEVKIPKKLLDGIPEAISSVDRHVVAAAVQEKAHVIVTSRPSCFSAEALEEHGILVDHPDSFFVHQFHLCPGRILEAMDAQALAIGIRRRDLILRLSTALPKFTNVIKGQK